MADLTIQNLTKYYGDKLILDNISFDVQAGEKVALLGANGTGKTTLFRILTGRLSHDSGTVSVSAGRTVGIIDQMPDFPKDATVDDVLRSAFAESDAIASEMLEIEHKMGECKDGSDELEILLKRYGSLSHRLEVLGGYNNDFEIDKVANGLFIPQNQRTQLFYLLSGGEQTRVNLARIILEHTDILLLDEPTNHLDMGAVAWLGDYLDTYKGTVLTISHDRWFLDRCCTRIIELRDHAVDFYAGSYSFFAEERINRIEIQQKQHDNELAEVKRLEAVSRKMHSHGTEHLAKRAASIDKKLARMKVTDRPRPEKKMSLTFGDPNYETAELLKVRDITKSYDNRVILQNVSFNVRNGDRIAMLGDNGTGKTTMLRLLLGTEAADGGSIRRGVGLHPAYLPQHVHFENEQRNLIDTLIYDKNITMQVARNRLGAFQFSGEDQFKMVHSLSGGEKSRLRLCELMYDPLNFLILDEPTNHLDILAREWMEEAVESFEGTLLFVSHDRYFVERFANRIIYLENGGIIDFEGTYEQFLYYRESGRLPSAKTVVIETKAPKKEKQPEKKKTGGTKHLAKQLGVLEREISQLEEKIEQLDNDMAEQASDHGKLMELVSEKEQAENELMEKMELWENISTEIEDMTS